MPQEEPVEMVTESQPGPPQPARLRCPAPISRLRVEKIEGGLMVAGVVVAANCQIVLPIFGFLFLLVGCVLTAASYRGPGEDEAPDSYAARIAFTGNSRILGPACIVIGIIMLVFGSVLCWLTRRARRSQQRVGFHCPLHGDFYPLSPVAGSVAIGKGDNSNWPLCWKRSGNNRLGAVHAAPPQCPHSQLSSTRSSLSSSPVSPCPTPLPFLVNSGSASGLVPLSGSQLSPDQTFGSIRSLSVSREVASFPLSRTPTPPPSVINTNRYVSPQLSPTSEVQPIQQNNTIANTSTMQQQRAPRKSVSIVLPDEEKG